MTPNNPLQQYFRQPAIYIKLPSLGQFYPPGTLTTTETGDLPVYPMTAIDEITYRTPDALFNGQATVNVIQSCMPNIINAWAIPAMDIDTILVAIRIASYGHEMEFGTACPKCAAESNRALDLRSVLDRIQMPDYNKSIQTGDIEIYFRPMNYKNLNDNSQMQRIADFTRDKKRKGHASSSEETCRSGARGGQGRRSRRAMAAARRWL